MDRTELDPTFVMSLEQVSNKRCEIVGLIVQSKCKVQGVVFVFQAAYYAWVTGLGDPRPTQKRAWDGFDMGDDLTKVTVRLSEYDAHLWRPFMEVYVVLRGGRELWYRS